jgi:peptidoglycan/LPS O-acetylase OafA/YrhL
MPSDIPEKNDERSQSARGARLHPLDTLRGLAALCVAMFWHYQHFDSAEFTAHRHQQPFFHALSWLYNYGWHLVDFFFVLSGFVFMHVYSRALVERRLSLRNYVVLRLSRLYPLHLATLLVVAGVQFYRVLSGGDFFIFGNNDAFSFVLNLGFVQCGLFDNGRPSFNGPAWSISIEFVAYVIFFAVLTRTRHVVRYSAVLVSAGILMFVVNASQPILNGAMSRVLIGFFAGCVVFRAHERLLAASAGTRRAVLAGLAVVLAGGAAMCAELGYMRFMGKWQVVMPLVAYPGVILLSLGVPPLRALLSLRPLAYLGSLSFTIYMIHFPAQTIYDTVTTGLGIVIDPRQKAFFFAYLAALLVLSALVHHLFELPAQRWARRKYLLPDAEAARMPPPAPASSGP